MKTSNFSDIQECILGLHLFAVYIHVNIICLCCDGAKAAQANHTKSKT